MCARRCSALGVAIVLFLRVLHSQTPCSFFCHICFRFSFTCVAGAKSVCQARRKGRWGGGGSGSLRARPPVLNSINSANASGRYCAAVFARNSSTPNEYCSSSLPRPPLSQANAPPPSTCPNPSSLHKCAFPFICRRMARAFPPARAHSFSVMHQSILHFTRACNHGQMIL